MPKKLPHPTIALISKPELAEHLGVSEWTLGDWMRKGILMRPTVRLAPNVHRWRVSDIEAWLAKMSRVTYVPPALKGKAHFDRLAKVHAEEGLDDDQPDEPPRRT